MIQHRIEALRHRGYPFKSGTEPRLQHVHRRPAPIGDPALAAILDSGDHLSSPVPPLGAALSSELRKLRPFLARYATKLGRRLAGGLL